MSRLNRPKFLASLLIVLGLFALGVGGLALGTRLLHPSRLAEVIRRGYIKCGVEGTLPHISLQITADDFADAGSHFYSNAQGFDADFCRVIAVAIFGDYENRVAFINMSAQERFLGICDGTIDVLIRNTTWTANRDVSLCGIDFGPVIFHDGQKFLVRKDDNIEDLPDLNGEAICVLPNTTTIDNLRTRFDSDGIAYSAITESRPGIPFDDNWDVFEVYQVKRTCKAMTADSSQLVAVIADLDDDEDRYRVIPEQAISYEPLAPVVAEGDSQWRDVVSYAIWTTIYAEELGITQGNVDRFNSQSTLDYKEFLGIDDPLIDQHIGPKLGLAQGFTTQVIARMGNYEEIYARHLGELIPDRGPNQVWELNHEGRLYSPPFK